MQDTIWIHTRYRSQFGLLGAMSSELTEAFVAKGYDARQIQLAQDDIPTEGILFFMNVPVTLDDLPPTLFTKDPTMRALQLYVDHPFGLPSNILDQWNDCTALSNYRLCLPCLDDAHILRPRFPNLDRKSVV